MASERSNRDGLIFGIYPGLTGTEPGLAGGPPHDPGRTDEAMGRLHPPGSPFVVRAYLGYHGPGQAAPEVPNDPARYIHSGRRLDCVLCYCTPEGDLEGWCGFVRAAVRRFGPLLDAIQITEEPNNPDATTGGNGSFPRVREAIIEGVIAAREEAGDLGLRPAIGFNASPSFDPNDTFWPELADHAGNRPAFVESLGYVGFDFFPDVFRPVRVESLARAIEGVLEHFRSVNLKAGNLPSGLPIRITENGWPTGPDRPESRQAEVLDTIVRIVHRLRVDLNITHYEFFAMRDSNTCSSNFWTRFGLLRDDYTPKPAFETYRRLIAELGQR